MNTSCQTCTHWRKVAYKGLSNTIVANDVGECRGGPPVADFKWARTRGVDTCANWTAVQGKVGAVRSAAPRQTDIFEAGAPGAGPAAVVLAYEVAAPGSTPTAPGPASISSQAEPPRNTRKTRKDNP